MYLMIVYIKGNVYKGNANQPISIRWHCKVFSKIRGRRKGRYKAECVTWTNVSIGNNSESEVIWNCNEDGGNQ